MNSEKNNLGLGVLIGFLCLIIGILGGYIISNNVSSKKSDSSSINSNDVEDSNYDVKIEDAFISTNISDSSFLSALESSKHSEGEFIEGANCAYVFKDYNSSILDEYFK